jgi:hypothetical protein
MDMKKINLFDEPIQKFDFPKPEEIVSAKVYFPGDPKYEEMKKLINQHPETVIQQMNPHGFLWCLNKMRRAEFALRKWIEQQPNPEAALKLLNGIMLLQDYIFETNSMEMGYAVNEQNDRINLILQEMNILIKDQRLDTNDLL